MKALLTAIKLQLQTDLTYVRDKDIFVTEDDNLIPSAIKFPAVGIKDGPVVRTEEIGGMMEYALTVKIIAYVQLLKPEAAIMGVEVVLSNWAAITPYVLDDRCKPTTPNDHWYICTVAGTSDAVEPTWPTTIGETVVDGTATWKCIDASAGEKGILDMEADIHESLDENLLAITGMISAVALPNQPESELFGDETEVVVRKVISYRYEKETARPSA